MMDSEILPSEPPRGEIIPPIEDIGGGLPSAVPGMDLKSGLAHVRGNHTLFKQLLYTFNRDHRGDMDILNRCIAVDDHAQAQRIAHTLKGVTGTLGAASLHAAASALNMALINHKSIEHLHPLLESLETLLSQVVQSIDGLNLHGEQEELLCLHPQFPREGVVALVQQLKHMVDEYDPEAVVKAKEVLCQLLESEWEQAARAILAEVDAYNFSSASELITAIEKDLMEHG